MARFCYILFAVMQVYYLNCHRIKGQYLNLATTFLQKVDQSSTMNNSYSNGPENAVDNNTDQNFTHKSCSSTLYGNPAWWRLEFTERVYIQEIIIYLVNNLPARVKLFKGSQVYISENGQCNGKLVYEQTSDPTAPWQDTFHITANTDGKYLLVCHNKYVSICEIQTIGCPYGKYDERCNKTCGNCQTTTCDVTNGTCPGDCEPFYTGARCDMTCVDRCNNSVCDKYGCSGCVDGKYGAFCDQKCSSNCNSQNCKQDDGLCEDGCPYGKYGERCNKTCGNCQTTTCDLTNGTCPYDCEPFYTGARCDMTCVDRCKNSVCDKYGCNGCVDGKYGAFCDQKCSSNCNSQNCKQDDGSCEDGFRQACTIATTLGTVLGVLVVVIAGYILFRLWKKRCRPLAQKNVINTSIPTINRNIPLPLPRNADVNVTDNSSAYLELQEFGYEEVTSVGLRDEPEYSLPDDY